MIDIPKDIEKYLVRDEIVDKQFELNDHTVFTTTNRLFIKKGNAVKDISYNHISSIELGARRKWITVFIGILLIAYNYLTLADRQAFIYDMAVIFPNGTEQRVIDSGNLWLVMNFLGIIGFLFLIIGFLWKTPCIKFSVVGMSREQKLSGNRNTLNALFRLVSERRVQP